MSVLRGCAWLILGVGLVLPPATHGTPSGAQKLHKLIVYPTEGETVSQLKANGAAKVEDYGSYWVVEADEATAAKVQSSHGDRAIKADYLNWISLRSGQIDAAAGEPAVPTHLRQAEGAGQRLRLIQFKGPVLPQWLDQVKAAGNLKIVSYVPNNAYVIWLDAKTEKNLSSLLAPTGPLQWIGAYHGSYKVPPALLTSSEPSISIQLAVVNGPDAEQSLRTVELYAQQPLSKPSILSNQVIVRAKVNPAALAALAQLPEVLWIERDAPIAPKDESQALVMADKISELPGHSPVPGIDDYLDLLTNSWGFSVVPSEYPVLDVADTLATSTILDDDFYEFGNPTNATRLAGFLSLCPSSATLCENFHGPFVMSVASGFNSAYTSNNVTAAGFRKGLGVSPFGRVSNTILFNLSGTPCVFCVPNSDHGISDIPLNEYMVFGARISNNSWGERPVAGNGGNLGIYNGDCVSYDTTTRDALSSGAAVANSNSVPPTPFPLNQEIITVFAGGNTQGLGSGNGGFGDIIVTPPATAKNVISVGASENVVSQSEAYNDCGLLPSESDNSYDISFFSSFGPTLDGRFKPEIVAPGAAIFAVNDGLNGQYVCDSGTSFSAPAVSGAIQLLWWWFEHRLLNEQGQNLLPPSPAMAKAYLINAARYLPISNRQTGAPDTLPSIDQGMGIIDLERMFDNMPRVIRDESTWRAIDTPLVTSNPAPQQTFFSQSGQSYEVSGKVADSSQPFRASLAWLDAPGSPNAAQQLVNDLDLEVRVGGKTYKGNVFSGPNSISGGAADSLNNLESVFMPAGQTGTWSVVVRAKTIAGDGVGNVRGATLGQDFALVVYNAAPGSSSDVPNLSTNNSCQNAIPITSFPYSFTNTLSKAIYSNVHPSPTAARGGIDEFFKIELPTAGTQFTIDTFGSKFDTVLSVWRVQVVPQSTYISSPCGALVELVSNNDAGGGNQSQVSFTADGSNTYYIVVDAHNDGAGGTMVLKVSPSTLPVSLTPSILTFGPQIIGTTSSVQVVTLVNNSTGSLNVDDAKIVGADPNDFVIVSQDCAGNLIPPGSNCTISVGFAPTAIGTRVAELVVTDDLIGSPRIVALNGQGLPPAPLICASVSSVDFGSVPIGATSAVQSIVITNCGTQVLDIYSVGLTGANAGDYVINGNGCGQGILVGASCTIDVSFAPTTNGQRSAALSISSNSPLSPSTVGLTGAGVNVQPDLLISKTHSIKKALGNGIFNNTGSGQTLSQVVRRGKSKTFYIAVQNAGSGAESFTVTGDGSYSGQWTVGYFVGAKNYDGFTNDVTSAVVAGSYATTTLAAGAITGDATLLRLQVTVSPTAASGTNNILVTARSPLNPSKADTVRAQIIVK
jgi:hypothetical protein